MALTTAKQLENPTPFFRVQKAGAAAAATYLPGEFLFIGGDDNLIKPVSASVVAGTQGCGFVTKKQIVVTAGDTLEYEQGDIVVSGSGFVASELNKIVWCSDSSLGVFDAQGTNRIQIGRYQGPVLGSSFGGNCIIRVGNVPSGSTI